MNEPQWVELVKAMCTKGFNPDGDATAGAQLEVADANGTIIYQQPIAREVRYDATEQLLWIRQIIGVGPQFDPNSSRRRSLPAATARAEGDTVIFALHTQNAIAVIKPAGKEQLRALSAWDAWKLTALTAQQEQDLDALTEDSWLG